MNSEIQKKTGSYYTCDSVASYIAGWAIDRPQMSVLEPSFGDGIFIDSALERFSNLGNNEPDIIGVELQEEPFVSFMKSHSQVKGYKKDFMEFSTRKKIDAVIGNPPYVSLKNLKEKDKNKAISLMSLYGVTLQSTASLWVPFIIHSTKLLARNGKLGFVLPYELTYVCYANDLWKFLANNYGSLTVCRVFHDFFPEVDVETVLLLAEEKGKKTQTVSYRVANSLVELFKEEYLVESAISIDEIIQRDKPFEWNLLPQATQEMIKRLKTEKVLSPLINECKFKIGYVAGDKNFFHPSAETIEKYKIASKNCKPCLINAKEITSNEQMGIETRAVINHSYLFYPQEIDKAERQYIELGETKGVDKKYKCSKRKPWYIVPGLEIPDIILTVFGDVPKLLLNDGRYYVSNSLLSGFLKDQGATKELVCRWYNSLTLLMIEITIHSLGGGTLVLIPGETDMLEVVSDFPRERVDATYERIATFARTNDAADIYDYGNKIVLQEIYGFSEEIIADIKQGVDLLRSWRITEKRRCPSFFQL